MRVTISALLVGLAYGEMKYEKVYQDCCRFDGWEAIRIGSRTDQQCAASCWQDDNCVAYDLSHVGHDVEDEGDCHIFFQKDNKPVEKWISGQCGPKDACFRKVLEKPEPEGEWVTLFGCQGPRPGNSNRVVDKEWSETARYATKLRICNAGSEEDCVTTTDENVALKNLRSGIMNLQDATLEKCDRECINQNWTGPDELLRRLVWGGGVPHGKKNFYHAYGNGVGLHMSINQGGCEWNYMKSIDSLVVQVYYVPPPPAWRTIFGCTGPRPKDLPGEENRIKDKNWRELAESSTQLRICTAGSEEMCVTATEKNIALENLREGNMYLQDATVEKCDRKCADELWTGPEELMIRMVWGTCLPEPEINFYHACGNGQGLHFANNEGYGGCEWNYMKSVDSLVVQVLYAYERAGADTPNPTPLPTPVPTSEPNSPPTRLCLDAEPELCFKKVRKGLLDCGVFDIALSCLKTCDMCENPVPTSEPTEFAPAFEFSDYLEMCNSFQDLSPRECVEVGGRFKKGRCICPKKPQKIKCKKIAPMYCADLRCSKPKVKNGVITRCGGKSGLQ